MLNLTDKDFNGTVDITSYIIELKKEIKELYLNKETEGFNEQMIKAMMTQMGRTPSQKQVNQMMKQMTKYMD